MSYEQLAESVDALATTNAQLASAAGDAITKAKASEKSAALSATNAAISAQRAASDVEAAISNNSSTVGSIGKLPLGDASGRLDNSWLPADLPTGEQVSVLAETISNTNVDQRSMFMRKKVLDLPMRSPYHSQILDAYLYTYIYPLGLVVDASADQIIVSYGSVGGNNTWCWLMVYQFSTGVFLNCVRLEYVMNESMVIRYENGSTVSDVNFDGATRYLYCTVDYSRAAAGQSNIAKLDLTTILTANAMSALTPTFPTTARAFSWLDWTGEEWIVQRYSNTAGRFRRYLFDRYNSDFSSKLGTISTPFSFTGDVSGANYLTSPKSQGFAVYNGGLYCSMGAPYSTTSSSSANNDPKAPGKQYGLAFVGADGSGLRTALCQADRFMAALAPYLDYTPLQCEAEGLSSNNGKLYSLFVMAADSPVDLYTCGIVIFEELSTDPAAIDFYNYSAPLRGSVDIASFQSAIHSDTTQSLVNPTTGAALTTYAAICSMMLGIGLTIYQFSGNGQTLTDFAGASVTTDNKVFRFVNLTGNTFFLSIVGATTQEFFYLTLSTLTQTRSGFSVAASSTTLPITGGGYTAINDGALGKVTTFRQANTASTHYEFYSLNTAGDARQLAGYISTSNLTTSYNTASDSTLKNDLGAMDSSKALEILNLITIHKFSFIGSDDSEEYGPFAQELYEVYPQAVTPGYWYAVNPETGVENVCQECEVATYVPWAVDKSKLVDVVVVSLQNIDARLKALENQQI